MNDNDIIKALECCIDSGGCSDRCPYHKYKYEVHCMKQHGHDLLGLINRQKAEIEELRNENLELKDGYFQKRYEETEHQELLGLRKAWRKSQMDYIDLNAEWEGKYKIAKAEAIREFAKRLKRDITINNTEDGCLIYSIDYGCLMEDIDNLVKEMTEDKDA